LARPLALWGSRRHAPRRSTHARAGRRADRVLRRHVPRVGHGVRLLDRARLRQPAPPAAARGLLDRHQRRRLPDAVALRVAWAGGPDARYGAAGHPLDPVPYAFDRDCDDRAAQADSDPPFTVSTL